MEVATTRQAAAEVDAQTRQAAEMDGQARQERYRAARQAAAHRIEKCMAVLSDSR